MHSYRDAQQLQAVLENLFNRIAKDPAAVKSVGQARLIIRLDITHPKAEVVINGRKTPPQIVYSKGSLRPDLDIRLSAETLHRILMSDLRLRAAVTSGLLEVRGPVWKSFVLEDIFHSAQNIYPQIFSETSSQD